MQENGTHLTEFEGRGETQYHRAALVLAEALASAVDRCWRCPASGFCTEVWNTGEGEFDNCKDRLLAWAKIEGCFR